MTGKHMKVHEIKKLNKAYDKSLARLQKDFFVNKDCGLVLFVEYLKYLRDTIILDGNGTMESKTRVASIIAAIAEFDSYKQSNEDPQQKAFHWNNFCEFLKLNMEDWLNINDSV